MDNTIVPIAAPVTTSASVQVVPATDNHINWKTFYKGLQAAGVGLLTLNLWIGDNPALVVMASHKWIWVGPLVSFIARIAEVVQTYKQKGRTVPVNNTVPSGEEVNG